MAAAVRNVKVKSSPQWLRERLRKCGLRPINNIVDITNYVMLEYGQPMHAFDYRNISDKTIIIRQAAEGETIVTLDGEEHELDSSMMVIADSKRPLALAGIMGSEHSGVYDDTTVVVFESACFNNLSVRFTARKLGMRTDSSALFEKGLDPCTAETALARALELVAELDAGDAEPAVIDLFDELPTPRIIELEPERINSFLGTSLETEYMKEALERFGFSVNCDLDVCVPSFRNDVEGMADLAEEIARLYGYDNIPSTIMSGISTASFTEEQRFENEIKALCVSAGLYETTTLSFMSNKSLDMLCIPKDSPLRNAVKISNPFGEETSLMRTTLLTSLMETVARNINVRNKAASFFELSARYIPQTEDELPLENKALSIAGYGDMDFYILKGILESICNAVGVVDLSFTSVTDNPSFHPGRCAKLTASSHTLAVLGELHPDVLSNYGIRTRCYAAELEYGLLYELRGKLRQYAELPKFPSITRDLALVCDEEVMSADIINLFKETGGYILENIEVFDVYRGDNLPHGKKSIAYSLTLRDRYKTLTDSDADILIAEILKLLSAKGIVLRR